VRYLKELAKVVHQAGGDIPDTEAGLKRLPGVGQKVAIVCLQHAWGKTDGIGVDVHLHRLANRLGWVNTSTPEATRASLERWFPKELWFPSNKILGGFGQVICKKSPQCDKCQVAHLCPSSLLPPSHDQTMEDQPDLADEPTQELGDKEAIHHQSVDLSSDDHVNHQCDQHASPASGQDEQPVPDSPQCDQESSGSE